MAAGIEASEKRKPTSLNPGDIIRCTTRLGEDFKGEVMGYDESTQAVVISILFTNATFFLKPSLKFIMNR